MLTYSFILSILFFANIYSSVVKVDQLAGLQWEYRIVLGVVENENLIKSAVNVLEANEIGIKDRKIAYFITNGQQHHTNYQGDLDEKIWQEVTKIVDKTNDKFILIGLDGGVKARYKALDVDQIFTLIDTMPMRQQEMQKDESN